MRVTENPKSNLHIKHNTRKAFSIFSAALRSKRSELLQQNFPTTICSESLPVKPHVLGQSRVGPMSLSTRCNATKAVTNGGAVSPTAPATSQCSCCGAAPGSASSAVNSQSSADSAGPQRAVKRAPTGPGDRNCYSFEM